MEVVGAVRSGDAAVVLARKIQPNILLIDYELPTQGGIATTEAITSLLPGA